MSQSNHNNRPQEEEIDLREELERYLKHWPYFVLGVLVCVVLAFTYLKVTTPTYHTLASIIIKDEKGKSPSSEMAAFADLGLLGGMGTASIENEIGILRSKRMMTNVVKALKSECYLLRRRCHQKSGALPEHSIFCAGFKNG